MPRKRIKKYKKALFEKKRRKKQKTNAYKNKGKKIAKIRGSIRFTAWLVFSNTVSVGTFGAFSFFSISSADEPGFS